MFVHTRLVMAIQNLWELSHFYFRRRNVAYHAESIGSVVIRTAPMGRKSKTQATTHPRLPLLEEAAKRDSSRPKYSVSDSACNNWSRMIICLPCRRSCSLLDDLSAHSLPLFVCYQFRFPTAPVDIAPTAAQRIPFCRIESGLPEAPPHYASNCL